MDHELIAYLDARFRESAEHTTQQFAALRQETMERFEKIDGRFDRMDERFEKIDERFDKNDERFDRIEGRLDRMDERFDRIEGRLDKNDERLDKNDERFDKNDERFERMERAIRETQVMVEDQRDKTQLLAEGISSVGEKLQELREEFNTRFDQAQQTTILYYTDLDRRLRVVEQRIEREGPIPL